MMMVMLVHKMMTVTMTNVVVRTVSLVQIGGYSGLTGRARSNGGAGSDGGAAFLPGVHSMTAGANGGASLNGSEFSGACFHTGLNDGAGSSSGAQTYFKLWGGRLPSAHVGKWSTKKSL